MPRERREIHAKRFSVKQSEKFGDRVPIYVKFSDIRPLLNGLKPSVEKRRERGAAVPAHDGRYPLAKEILLHRIVKKGQIMVGIGVYVNKPRRAVYSN